MCSPQKTLKNHPQQPVSKYPLIAHQLIACSFHHLCHISIIYYYYYLSVFIGINVLKSIMKDPLGMAFGIVISLVALPHYHPMTPYFVTVRFNITWTDFSSLFLSMILPVVWRFFASSFPRSKPWESWICDPGLPKKIYPIICPMDFNCCFQPQRS